MKTFIETRQLRPQYCYRRHSKLENAKTCLSSVVLWTSSIATLLVGGRHLDAFEFEGDCNGVGEQSSSLIRSTTIAATRWNPAHLKKIEVSIIEKSQDLSPNSQETLHSYRRINSNSSCIQDECTKMEGNRNSFMTLQTNQFPREMNILWSNDLCMFVMEMVWYVEHVITRTIRALLRDGSIDSGKFDQRRSKLWQCYYYRMYGQPIIRRLTASLDSNRISPK